MAYSNTSAAYDLNLFDEEASYSSAVPKHSEERVHKKQSGRKAKIVTLPESEIEKIRRRKHSPAKIFFGAVGSAAVTLVIGTIIVGQVQLTELNQKVLSAQKELSNSQSVYTQTKMGVESKLSNAEIEEYASSVLGMTKANNSQKEFVTLSGGDKAEVSAQANENLFTKFIDSVKNLWS